MLCESMLVYNPENNGFDFVPENMPKSENISELLKAFLILFSGYNIVEKGTDFTYELRKGSYDSFIDEE